MSKEQIVARRYAKALYEVTKEKGTTANAIDEMRTVVRVLNDSTELATFLNHPNVDVSDKTGLLKQVLEGKVTPEVLNTLVLLIDRKRSEIITDVYDQFVKVANEALGRAKAVVYTPKALSEPEAANIAEQFGKLTGKTIEVENVIDPALLGGLKVAIGDKLYDGSLKTKLSKLEKALVSTQAL